MHSSDEKGLISSSDQNALGILGLLRRWPSGGWIAVEALIIGGLSYVLFHESEANPLMISWLTNLLGPVFSAFSFWTIVLVTGAVTVIIGQLLARLNPRRERIQTERRIRPDTRQVLQPNGRPQVSTRLPVGLTSRNVPELEVSQKSLRVFSPEDPYGVFGVALIMLGILTLTISLFAKAVAMEALGLACIVLGFTAISLPHELTGSRSMGTLLQGSLLHVESLLEPYSVQRAVYLPPDDRGPVFAYVPLKPGASLQTDLMRKVPTAIVDKDQTGLLVYPVGAQLTRLPELHDGLSLEEALRYVLIESAELCSNIDVHEKGGLVTVAMENVKVDTNAHKYLISLGSIPSSLAACVIATTYNRPVSVVDERTVGRQNIARFRAES